MYIEIYYDLPPDTLSASLRECAMERAPDRHQCPSASHTHHHLNHVRCVNLLRTATIAPTTVDAIVIAYPPTTFISTLSPECGSSTAGSSTTDQNVTRKNMYGNNEGEHTGSPPYAHILRHDRFIRLDEETDGCRGDAENRPRNENEVTAGT